MIGGTPVLYVRHSALDAVEADNIDQLGEVWSSFRGAKKSLNQGARLEYLSWRLYTRGILQKHRAKEANPEVPLLVEPPGLEMSSSSESIHRGFSSQRVVDLFDRICTYPATPVGTLKPCPTFLPRDLVSEPEAIQITPVPAEPEPVPEPTAGIDIQRRTNPEVCRFDQVSVNDRSYVSLAQPETARLNALSGLGTQTTAPSMFFIESSSDSEPDAEKDINVPIPTPLRPGLVRRKTVTFEEPKQTPEPNSTRDNDDDEYEDIDDEDEEEDEIDDEIDDENENENESDRPNSDSNWGDSDWDDFSEDDEPMFSARAVPVKLQQRRSLLSSMFAGSLVNRVSTPEQPDHVVPSPQSEPRTSNFQVGSAPYLGRVASQSSMFESAMHNSGNAVENILLNNNLQSHIPIMQIPGSHSRATSISNDEVMERELSQSIRSDLSHKRQYDLDVLWRSQRAETAASQRRPTLGRSTTMPVPSGSAFNETDDLQDPQSYHARGW